MEQACLQYSGVEVGTLILFGHLWVRDGRTVALHTDNSSSNAIRLAPQLCASICRSPKLQLDLLVAQRYGWTGPPTLRFDWHSRGPRLPESNKVTSYLGVILS